MGLEKIGLEALEHIRLSEEILKPLWQIASKFEDFLFKSPWKNAVTTALSNGRTLKVGEAGAKVVEGKSGVLVHRKLASVFELPDGSPALRYQVSRPSGVTRFDVKINPNGTFSPVRL